MEYRRVKDQVDRVANPVAITRSDIVRPGHWFYSLCKPYISSLEQSLTYLLSPKESYDDLSQKDVESLSGRSLSSSNGSGLSSVGGAKGKSSWKLKSVVTLALTLLTSSQAILIVWSKRAGKYEYSVTTANFSVEALKCLLSLAALFRTWNRHGVTDDNRLTTSFDEVSVYPIPAILYMVKNLLQYYIFAYVDAPAYQILKNLNIISTGVLYRIILKKKLVYSEQLEIIVRLCFTIGIGALKSMVAICFVGSVMEA
nr:unnamed protein product [Digitaria exilis]